MSRLENDLRALRLVHDKVIDTAIVRTSHRLYLGADSQLFPHDKGKPFRRALRDMYVCLYCVGQPLTTSVKEKLGYFIQDRTADLGHSSAEDAKATLECLKWKIRCDAE